MNIIIVSLGKTASGNQDHFFFFLATLSITYIFGGWGGTPLANLILSATSPYGKLSSPHGRYTQVFLLHLIPPKNADNVMFPKLQLHYNAGPLSLRMVKPSDL